MLIYTKVNTLYLIFYFNLFKYGGNLHVCVFKFAEHFGIVFPNIGIFRSSCGSRKFELANIIKLKANCKGPKRKIVFL